MPNTARPAKRQYSETRDRTGDLQIFGLTVSQLSYRGNRSLFDNAHITAIALKKPCDNNAKHRKVLGRLPRKLKDVGIRGGMGEIFPPAARRAPGPIPSCGI